MSRLPDIGRLPPGDRAPVLMYAARRHLAALEDPRASPGRIAANRIALRRIASVAKRHAVTLPPTVAAQAAPFTRRTETMSTTQQHPAPAIASGALTEDLREMPIAEAVQVAMRRGLEAGMLQHEVIETAMAAVAMFAIEVDGPRKTAARMLLAADQIAAMAPAPGARTN